MSVSDIKTTCSWQDFLGKVINDFKKKVYIFNQIAEMNIITKVKKLDMSYDLYIRHYMHAVEWKLNAMINKIERSINKLDRN